MEIRVDVSNLEAIDLTTVIGTRLVWDDDHEERVPQDITLADLVSDKLVREITTDDQYPLLRRQVMDMRIELIREALEPIIKAALANPMQRTNLFGEPTGPATTLREIILDETKKIINEKPNHSSSGRPHLTYLQQLIQKEVRDVFGKEMVATLKEEKEKLLALVRNEGARIMADTLQSTVATIQSKQ